MIYLAEIDIMPLRELLDPQGKAVENGLSKMNLSSIKTVRIGKHITLKLEAASEAEAKAKVEEACNKLLVNRIMENFVYKISQVQE
ncbi:MAG: phosphoribosylformylglycinamidine synthase subunit PurS [Chitinophagales bacterium]|nr:phosphoribosylformylglycinamidine synthase subunit PurS [Chitinophagales bacterium]